MRLPKVPLPASLLSRATLRRGGEFVVAGALAVVLLVFGLPRVADVSWHQIGATLTRVDAAEIAVLAGVWLAGLWVHTIALSAALPGLSHRRAFFLNISGSAVSNLLPLGGTAGSAVNYWATKTWGFSVSTTLENEAITTGENEATQTDWMGDLSGGLGFDPAAGRGRCSAAAGRTGSGNRSVDGEAGVGLAGAAEV